MDNCPDLRPAPAILLFDPETLALRVWRWRDGVARPVGAARRCDDSRDRRDRPRAGTALSVGTTAAGDGGGIVPRRLLAHARAASAGGAALCAADLRLRGRDPWLAPADARMDGGNCRHMALVAAARRGCRARGVGAWPGRGLRQLHRPGIASGLACAPARSHAAGS